jgi:Putative Ig domain
MQRRNSLALLLGFFLVSLQIMGCGGGGGSSTTLVIAGTLPSTGTVAVAYTGSLTVSGGSGTYTWTATGLPTGLSGSSANTSTLTISGTPTRAGTYNVNVKVVDSNSNSTTYTVSIVVAAPATPVISGTLPVSGNVGTAYTGSLTASGGTAPYTWVVTGLPAGVTASGTSSSTLTVSGTPTTAATNAVAVTLTDSNNGSSYYDVSVVIAGPKPPTISGALPATGTVNIPYSGSLTVVGGTAPYTWTVTGLPAGITATGTSTPTITVAGTPTTAGTNAVSVGVTDANANSATAYMVSIVINPPVGQTLVISPTTFGVLNNGGAIAPITVTSAPASTAPYTWTVSAGALPEGLVLNNGTTTNATTITSTTNSITISGTPTATGSYSLALSITDSASPAGTGSQSYVGAVNDPVCSATPQLRGNESALKAPYAFLLKGAGNGHSHAYWAGSFTPNGSGGITAGDLDSLSQADGPAYSPVGLAGSLYSYGPDGRGCLYLSYGGSTVTYSFALSPTQQSGRIEQFDYVTSKTVAAGQMHQQTSTDFALASLASNFAFGLDGWAIGAGTTARTALAGSVANSTTGALSGGYADVNIGGAVGSALTGGSGSLATGTVSTTTGRGEGTFTISNGGVPLTFTFAYYVINSSDLYIVSADQAAVGNYLLAGRAVAAAATAKALNGYYMPVLSGLDSSGGSPGNNVVSVGTAQLTNKLTNGNFGVPSATLYTNDAGKYAAQTYPSGTYAMATASGRINFSGLGGTPPVGYLTANANEDNIAAFLVGTDAPASSGFLALQTLTKPNFFLVNVSGIYAFGTGEDVASSTGSKVGTYTFNGTGGYSSTLDVVANGEISSQPNQTAGGTNAINGDGSGSFDGATKILVTNGTLIFAIDATTGNQPQLYTFIQQVPPPE